MQIPDRARGSFEQATDDVEIWQEHLRAFDLFKRCGKLWRLAPQGGGVVGLDRPGLESLMRLLQVKRRHRLALLDEIAVMEDAAMAVINRKDVA